jgi:hypothetical protein
MSWMDKKPVIILSSVSSALLAEDIDGKPAAIRVYNQVLLFYKVMPGVDGNDQMKFGRKVARPI